MREPGAVRYGNTDISYTVIRSARRKKTIQITVDPEHGVMIAAPVSAASDAIADIVLRRANWILSRTESARLGPRPKLFVSGETLPYMGREVRMDVVHAEAESVRIRFSHWAFEVSVPAQLQGEDRQHAIRTAFIQWYRRRAADTVRKSLARWSAQLSLAPSRAAIRDQRRRWGSCAPDGTLRFNWRVAMIEPALLEYIVVHELAHLRHHNHSRDFWRVVEEALPDYLPRRRQLREMGDRLPF